MRNASKGRAIAAVGVVVAMLLGAAAITLAVWPPDGGDSLDVDDEVTLSEARPVVIGYALDRADAGVGGDDVIIEVVSGAAESSAVYSDRRIIDFVIAGDDLVVVTEESGAHRVATVDIASGSRQEVALPGQGTVDALASDGRRVGLLFTSAGDPETRDLSSTLSWFEVGDPAVVPVTRGGQPLETAAWSWIPAHGEVLAIDSAEELLRFGPAGDSFAELGEWEGIEAVSSDGSRAIVRDHHDTVDIVLATGEATPFGPTPIDGAAPFGGDVAFLGAGPQRIQKVALPVAPAGRMTSVIVLDDGADPRVLHRASDGEGVDEFSVSPDGAVVAVEVVPDVSAAVSDGYYPHARSVSVVTRFVSISDGSVIGEIAAFGIQWRQSVD